MRVSSVKLDYPVHRCAPSSTGSVNYGHRMHNFARVCYYLYQTLGANGPDLHNLAWPEEKLVVMGSVRTGGIAGTTSAVFQK